MAALLSLDRGRARDWELRQLTRVSAARQLACEIRPFNRYVETARNPSDYDSRATERKQVRLGELQHGPGLRISDMALSFDVDWCRSSAPSRSLQLLSVPEAPEVSHVPKDCRGRTVRSRITRGGALTSGRASRPGRRGWRTTTQEMKAPLTLVSQLRSGRCGPRTVQQPPSQLPCPVTTSAVKSTVRPRKRGPRKSSAVQQPQVASTPQRPGSPRPQRSRPSGFAPPPRGTAGETRPRHAYRAVAALEVCSGEGELSSDWHVEGLNVGPSLDTCRHECLDITQPHVFKALRR